MKTILILIQTLSLTTPGVHVLTSNLAATNGAVIDVATNNVTVDLNGFTVECQPPDPAVAPITVGVRADGRNNVTIQNGFIRGCQTGVRGNMGQSFKLANLDVSATYICAQLAGGSNNLISQMRCHDVGGYALEAYAVGLNGVGSNSVVEDSRFEEIYRQRLAADVGEGVAALSPAGEVGTIWRRNILINKRPEKGSIGMWFGDGATGTIEDTQVINFNYPVAAYASATITGAATVSYQQSGQIDLVNPVVAPGAPISFTVQNVDPMWPMDWVALTPLNGADNSYIDWLYLNGSKTAPSAGINQAQLTFTAPMAAGQYNIRMYANNSLAGKLATSTTITVTTSAPPPVEPPTLNQKWFRICSDNVCYSGLLTKEQGE